MKGISNSIHLAGKFRKKTEHLHKKLLSAKLSPLPHSINDRK